MDYLLFAAAIIVGFGGLIWSADKFVLGASTTARNLGVSTLMIGLTIVSFGTSAPEIFTSGAAALRNVPELAIGNVLGSNIANIGLVLAITLLVCPLEMPRSLLRQELPALLFTTAAVLYVFQDLDLSRIDGLLLLVILAFFTWRVILRSRTGPGSGPDTEEVAEYIADISTARALGLVFFGLVLMILSARVLVFGSSGVARALGVSELIIGLTIVAIGTSLPELAASITSAVKGHHGLAIGNIIGSNILNLLMVLPVPALLSPVAVESAVLWRDYSAMLAITLLFSLLSSLKLKTGRKLGRLSGAVLLLLYLAYTALLIFTR